MLKALKRKIIRELDSRLDLFKWLAKERGKWLTWHSPLLESLPLKVKIIERFLDIIEDARIGESLDKLETEIKLREALAYELECWIARQKYPEYLRLKYDSLVKNKWFKDNYCGKSLGDSTPIEESHFLDFPDEKPH